MENRYFGPYLILKKLAEGAFSQIFEVSEKDQNFALKKLKPYLKYDREYISLLKTEAALLEKTAGLPHFPRLFRSGEVEGEFYLLLELIEGINLEKAVEISFQVGEPKNYSRAAHIVSEIAKGLKQLHAIPLFRDAPTLHGDLRRSNVMVSSMGEVKLIDLGLKGGTFDYMPLERLHDRILTPFTDIYALGHILYEVLHGKRLFKGTSKLEAYCEMRNLKVEDALFDPDIPTPLRKILLRSLHQDPRIRYGDIVEMTGDLGTYLSKEGQGFKPQELEDWMKNLKK